MDWSKKEGWKNDEKQRLTPWCPLGGPLTAYPGDRSSHDPLRKVDSERNPHVWLSFQTKGSVQSGLQRFADVAAGAVGVPPDLKFEISDLKLAGGLDRIPLSTARNASESFPRPLSAFPRPACRQAGESDDPPSPRLRWTGPPSPRLRWTGPPSPRLRWTGLHLRHRLSAFYFQLLLRVFPLGKFAWIRGNSREKPFLSSCPSRDNACQVRKVINIKN